VNGSLKEFVKESLRGSLGDKKKVGCVDGRIGIDNVSVRLEKLMVRNLA
jgi:hypothetical protein